MKHAIGAREQAEFLALFEGYKQDIVEAADRNASKQKA
jgi:hypothetical protein